MAAVDAANDNKSEAGRKLGVSRSTVYRRLGKPDARSGCDEPVLAE